MDIRRIRVRVLAAAAAACAAFAVGSARAAWPERPVTLIVPWGAGGGTDATARIIGSLLEKELGQPVNVVNRTGGSGVVGHQAIATAPPDGYTIGLITVEIGMMHWQGLTDISRRVVHADRPGQRRPGRPAGARRLAVQERQRPGRGDQGQPGQVQGLGHRPGRHLASRHRRHAEGPEGRSGGAALGAVERRRARPAGSGRRRRRGRAVLAARGALDDRRRQGESLAIMDDDAGRALSERADAEGGDRQRLEDRRLARHRGAQGHSGRRAATSSSRR